MKSPHFDIKIRKTLISKTRNIFILEKVKPCLHLMNRCNSLKHMQHFVAHDSNLKKKWKK